MAKPVIIGICGGSGSGKTTVVRMLREQYGADSLTVLNVDNYYRGLGHLEPDQRDGYNFDHPDALDLHLLYEQLQLLKQGGPVECPKYDFASHTRSAETTKIEANQVIAVDGILSLHDERLVSLYDISVFVEVADDLRFIRRLTRDIAERGRSMQSVVDQYLTTVKPMHDLFVEPQRHRADIVISWEERSPKAIQMLAAALRNPSDS